MKPPYVSQLNLQSNFHVSVDFTWKISVSSNKSESLTLVLLLSLPCFLKKENLRKKKHI